MHLVNDNIPLDGVFYGYDELDNERIDLDFCWVPLEDLKKGNKVYPLELIPYILETAKIELQERIGAVKFEIKSIGVYSVTGKNRVNDTGEETCGLLCFAEITEFAKELHSEMEKVVLMDELPENWTYPLIQPKLIEEWERREKVKR